MQTGLSQRRALYGLLLGASLLFAIAWAVAQTPQKPSPAKKSAAQRPATAAAPAAPVSKHFPILLIATGTDPIWSARIGMKGVERLERAGYPPITLAPGEIEQESAGAAWLYHAKDEWTTADVTLRLTRESCTDGKSDAKYSFRAVLTHAQIGELRGCAKIAPEQFPEFKQKNLDDDDPEKKKVQPPPITGFKPPTAVAFLDPAGKVMLDRGGIAKLVAAKGSQLSLSHDGKRLLYTREDSATERTIVLYDATTARSSDFLRGAQSAFWSPDDSQIAFLKSSGGAFQVWTAPSNSPDRAAQLASTPALALHGWQDLHTVLATDASKLYFLKTESPPSSLDLREIYGPLFQVSATDSIRANPMNSDLLVVTASSGPPYNSFMSFLFEVKAKRRGPLTALTLYATAAEWSRDGIQVFFTSRDAAKNASIYRIFWDGSGLKRIRAGSSLVIGQ